jgi:hypothetical protein
MIASSVWVDSVSRDDPEKLREMAVVAGAEVSDWARRLAGKRGLARLRRIAVLLFGKSSFTEHVKIELHGESSFVIQSVRIP